MDTIANEQLSDDVLENSFSPENDAINELTLIEITANTDLTKQLFLPSNLITHSPKYGLNPLVDAAAYLFSTVGKLKEIQTYANPNKLQKELIREIITFQDTAKSLGYNSEYILISRYALCVTLDEIVVNTPWSASDSWNERSLLSIFTQESVNPDHFFILLERLVKDPERYIDLMEFMYICLSLGFKGKYHTSETNAFQLEQITNALYKQIRTFRGDFNKILSPFQIKSTHPHKVTAKNMPSWLVILLVISISFTLFAGIRYILSITANEAYKDLTRLGKLTSYETDDHTIT
jgi:type VI secretion system protein ImpK